MEKKKETITLNMKPIVEGEIIQRIDEIVIAKFSGEKGYQMVLTPVRMTFGFHRYKKGAVFIAKEILKHGDRKKFQSEKPKEACDGFSRYLRRWVMRICKAKIKDLKPFDEFAEMLDVLKLGGDVWASTNEMEKLRDSEELLEALKKWSLGSTYNKHLKIMQLGDPKRYKLSVE